MARAHGFGRMIEETRPIDRLKMFLGYRFDELLDSRRNRKHLPQLCGGCVDVILTPFGYARLCENSVHGSTGSPRTESVRLKLSI